MEAMPHTNPDPSAGTLPVIDPSDSMSLPMPLSLTRATESDSAAPPPHLLWASLESAYAALDDFPPTVGEPVQDEQRFARCVALPLALGLSLMLWVIIIELVIMR